MGKSDPLVGDCAGMGDGPGLVSRYINCFTSEGRVIVGAMDKLHFFDPNGRFISSTPNNTFESFPFAFTSDEVFFIGPGALANLPGGKASISKVTVTSGETKPIHDFTVDAFEPAIGKQYVDIFSPEGKYPYRGKIVLPEGDRCKNFDALTVGLYLNKTIFLVLENVPAWSL